MTVWGDLLCTPFGSGALGIRCFGSVARVLFGWVAKWLTRTPIPCKWLVWPVGRLAGQLAGRHVNLIGRLAAGERQEACRKSMNGTPN